MRVNSPEAQKVLHWWREQPLWRKILICLFHFEEWMSISALDKVDKQARSEIKHRVFGTKQI